MREYIITLDLGTTAVKATLFDETGHMVCHKQWEEELILPQKGYVEQNPCAWYERACGLVRDISAVTDGTVKGLGISSQGISFVAVNEDLKPLGNAICWLDERAKKQAEDIEKMLGQDEIYRVTGKYISEAYMLPKLLWVRRYAREIYQKTYKFLMPMDYAIARLTGSTITDPSMAAGSMMFDLCKRDWSSRILSAMGIDRALLPEIRESGGIVNVLHEEAAEATGLPVGTPVVCAGQDQKTAAYGAGLSEDSVTVSLGTAGAMEALTKNTGVGLQTGLTLCPYVQKGQWVMEGCINTAGAAIKWVKNTVFPEMDYADMNAMCAEASLGSKGVLFLPFLSEAGTPHGGKQIAGRYTGLTLATQRGDLVRALYEGIAFELKLNLEAAQKAGAKPTWISVFGGGSKSREFCQIIADVTGLRLRTFAEGELCSVGAAKMVAAACGMDVERFEKGALAGETWYDPIKENETAYCTIFVLYQKEIAESE